MVINTIMAMDMAMVVALKKSTFLKKEQSFLIALFF
jgi:hypothetical protein